MNVGHDLKDYSVVMTEQLQNIKSASYTQRSTCHALSLSLRARSRAQSEDSGVVRNMANRLAMPEDIYQLSPVDAKLAKAIERGMAEYDFCLRDVVPGDCVAVPCRSPWFAHQDTRYVSCSPMACRLHT